MQQAKGASAVSDAPAFKTMRLRYAGRCASCEVQIPKGETAHYLSASKTVRCLSCGPGGFSSPSPASDAPAAAVMTDRVDSSMELVQATLSRATVCGDCGRQLQRGAEAVVDPSDTSALCLECVTLDTTHTLGTAGGGARREHAKRRDRHQTWVRIQHPRLGGLILALNDDPSHVRAWQTGAVGEEEFGRALSSLARESIKVLHDRKIPRSAANIDHLAITSECVWVLDSKRYKGRVETRGHGLLSRRPPDLYVGGRNQTKLIAGVLRQVEVVQQILMPYSHALGMTEIPVRGGLVFINAEFGLFASPLDLDDVWIGWGKAIRKRLAEQHPGQLPVGQIAKHLARSLRAG